MRDGRVFASIEQMLAGATLRQPVAKSVDSLSGSPFERVVIDGRPYLVKYVGHGVDWLARALGDRACFVAIMWRAGLLDQLPQQFDHTIEAVAGDVGSGQAALLLRDVGPWLVPSGDGLLPLEQHRRLLAHMALMHATFWEFEDTFGLLPPANRYIALTPATGLRESAAEQTDLVPAILVKRWNALAHAAPQLHRDAALLAHDPSGLAAALDRGPATLIHGDWKAGNLGSHPDGRTILLDWGWPGRACPLVDLAWYLAVNCDRLPESKEQAISWYRECLHRQGIDTGSWWDSQLGLALLGAFVQLGWSKTHDPAELGWWAERVGPVARDLLGG